MQGERKKKRGGRKSGRKKKNPNEVKVPFDDNELTKRINATMKENKEVRIFKFQKYL